MTSRPLPQAAAPAPALSASVRDAAATPVAAEDGSTRVVLPGGQPLCQPAAWQGHVAAGPEAVNDAAAPGASPSTGRGLAPWPRLRAWLQRRSTAGAVGLAHLGPTGMAGHTGAVQILASWPARYPVWGSEGVAGGDAPAGWSLRSPDAIVDRDGKRWRI